MRASKKAVAKAWKQAGGALKIAAEHVEKAMLEEEQKKMAGGPVG